RAREEQQPGKQAPGGARQHDPRHDHRRMPVSAAIDAPRSPADRMQRRTDPGPCRTRAGLHLNTGGPNRPSLVAGSHAAAGPSTGRILADMENRRPGVPASTARRRPLAWILASGCIILVGFLVALQWPTRWSSPGAGMEPAGDGTVGQASSATQAPAASIDAVAPPRGAMIIDDPATDETKVALQALPSAGEPM